MITWLQNILEPTKDAYSLPTIIILLIVLLICVHEYRIGRYSWEGPEMDRPTPIPIFGNILKATSFNGRYMIHKYLELYKLYSKHGITRFWIFDDLFFAAMSPKYIEKMLTDVRMEKKPKHYSILAESPLGGGLISQLDKGIWKSHRKLVAPTFHFNILKSYIPTFYEETLILLKKIETKYGGQSSDPVKEENEIKVDNMHQLMPLCTFDMILRNAFGVNIKAQNNEDHPFLSAINRAKEITQNRITMPFLLIDSIFYLSGYKSKQEKVKKTCHEFTETVIRKKRLEYENRKQNKTSEVGKERTGLAENQNHIEEEINGKVRNKLESIHVSENPVSETWSKENKMLSEYELNTPKSFLELMIENEENETDKMSDAELRDNMITLMFAGQDTTATTICVTLLMLAIHQEVQNGVIQEIDAVFGGPDNDNFSCSSYNDIMQLELLERVIKESSRLYPAAPAIARVVEEDIKMGPYTLPRGSGVILFIFGLHRDESLYENATQFNPDRFLTNNIQQRSKYSYLPFSAGSRNCIGYKYAMIQMKVILSTILRQYHVTTDDNIKDVKHVDELIKMDLTLSLEKCPITFKRRF